MNGEPDSIRTLGLRERWADAHTPITQVLIPSLFAGVCFPAEQTGVGTAERTGAFVLPGTMILGTVIWHAVGFGPARIHGIINGVDLERRTDRGGDRSRG
jgi:hypothetical protein